MITPRLSVVIPCFNEAANLPDLVSACMDAADAADARGGIEFVLVDNGSNDESWRTLQKFESADGPIRSVRVLKNQGYGNGILEGLRATKGEFVGWTHADLQTDPGDAVRGLEIIKNSPTPHGLLVKGRRKGRNITDLIFTVGMTIFEAVLLGRWMPDINAQPTLFPRALFDSWVEPPIDFSIDLFAFYTAKRAGYATVRFPVTFSARQHGTSSWNRGWGSRIKLIKRTVEFSIQMKKGMSRS